MENKMKRIIFPSFIMLLFAVAFYGCCNCGQSNSSENTIRGVITMLGNDPFAEIGIKTEDNTNIVLKCSKELKKELIDAQGKLYLVQFSEKKNVDGVIIAVVEKAIPIIQK